MSDIPLTILTPPSHPTPVRAERRITPSWSLSTLKQKLLPVTGIPPSSQRLLLRLPDGSEHPLVAGDGEDEDEVQVGRWGLVRYAEIEVSSTHPLPSLPSLATTTSAPSENPLTPTAYASKPDTVLAFKRTHQLGRFDPSAPERIAARHAAWETAIQERGIEVRRRCVVGGEEGGGGGTEGRRGEVRFVGEVDQLPGGGKWIGIALDEPVGRNDGSIPTAPTNSATTTTDAGGDDDREAAPSSYNPGHPTNAEGRKTNDDEAGRKRYFHAPHNHGIFVRPERVTVGDFPELSIEDELEGLGSDMEEL